MRDTPAWLASSDPILSLRSVRKCFARGLARAAQRTVAIDGVDLDVAARDIVVVFGDEGAGKTTLLQCASGILRADAGCVAWHHAPLSSLALFEGIGYVPAVPVFYPFLTPRDVLAFRLSRKSSSALADAVTVAETLGALGLAEVADESILKLDRALLRRVAIAEALVSRPDLLVIDTRPGETISDRLLASIASHGTAILLGIRDCAAVASVATRLVHLEQGTIDRSFTAEREMMHVAETLH